MRHSRMHVAFAIIAVGLGTVAHSASGQTSNPSAELSPTMWAAQTDASTLRLAWDHVPGPTSYAITCDIGARVRQIGVSTVPLLTQKSATAPARRLSMTVALTDPGVQHRCFLQWRADPKSALSPRLAFNDVTPMTPAAGAGKTPAPGGATAQQTATTEITLTWGAVPGATAYIIGRSVQPSGFSLYCDVCPAQTTFVDRFVKAGATHAYSVSALGPGGASGRTTSNAVVATGNASAIGTGASPSVSPTLKPPSAVTATVTGATSTRVSWSAVPTAAGYQLLRSVNGATPAPLARIPAGTTAGTPAQIDVPDDVGAFLGAGATQAVVVYAVKSEDASGGTTAAATSNQLTITAKSSLPAGATSGNASNAVATATSASSVTLTWSPPAGGMTCALERALNGGAFAALPPLAAGSATWVDGAPNLLAYRPRYQITCGTAKSTLPPVSFSGPTWTIAPTGGAGASSLPTLPTNLRATLTSPDSVTLTWGPPTNAIACSLQRKSGSSVSYVTLLTLAIGTWYHADTQPGLAGAKPQYQLACGSAKSTAAVQFPNPT